MKSSLTFEKWQGLGNDFLVVDDTEMSWALTDEDIRALCDRRRGVGGDGVLLVTRAPGVPKNDVPVARMVVRNADGSRPEMCGNGLRCVAGYLARSMSATTFVVETDAGPRSCIIEATGEGSVEVTIDMGIVTVLDDFIVERDGKKLVFHNASAGNPHAITFDRISRRDFDAIAPELERAPARGTNVERVEIAGDALDVLVWERGVGYTDACGTGACAVARVAVAKGHVTADRAERGIEVRLPGGPLEIRVASDGRVRMRGPARRSFAGST